MNATAKKILNIALKVVTWLIVAVAVFMMIFTVFSVTTVDRNDRSLFGIKFYTVLSDSMSKSDKNADMDVHFNAGDIVIVKDVKDKTSLKEGDIISFISSNPESHGETVTHMIRKVEKNANGKVIGYVTFGTNKGVDDEALVQPEYVLGVYAGKLPGVGRFFEYVKTTPGYIVCILVPFLLLILYNGVNVIRLFRKYKREQMEEIRADKDKLEAERAENQRMMQELLALKAQLDKKESGEGTPPVKPASEAVPNEEAATDETVETKSEDAAPAETTDENN